MRLSRYVIIMLGLSLILGCRQQDNDMAGKIVGDWQLVNFSTNQIINNPEEYRKAAKQLILTTALIIRRDGTIKSIIWGTSENGYWEVKKDELIVYDKKKKTRFRARIVKLTDEQLLLYQRMGKVKVVLYFKRFD